MNYNFKIAGVELNLVNVGAEIKLGEISVQVEDLKVMESLQVMKTIPGILREIKEIFEEETISEEFEIHTIPPLGFPSHDCGSVFQNIFAKKNATKTCDGDCDEHSTDTASKEEEDDFSFDENVTVSVKTKNDAKVAKQEAGNDDVLHKEEAGDTKVAEGDIHPRRRGLRS